ncbi:hypothetical protein CK203_056840 [Vitis vinifera]|uniref:Uncharacterized protein n=1 Tax=Vitis vinifera TaxID=29760 RepID=A0A438GQA8_VITVI|nr:hypothetical protein CK203_056840 [Vitis vinifera]
MLPVYIQSQSSITSEPICSTAKADLGWMHDIVKYLQTGELPEDGKHAHKVHVQAFRFTLIIDSLNRRSFRGPYLRCLSDPKAQYVLAKLHKGVCGNHLGSQKSNASNRVRFGAEMRKIWPSEDNCSRLVRNSHNTLKFAQHLQSLALLFLLFHFHFLASQTSSEDVFPEDERLNLWFLGVKEASCACHIEYKIAEESMNFMSYVAEVSRGWDEPNARNMARMTSQPKAKAEMYILNDGMNMKANIAAMERRLEELEMNQM